MKNKIRCGYTSVYTSFSKKKKKKKVSTLCLSKRKQQQQRQVSTLRLASTQSCLLPLKTSNTSNAIPLWTLQSSLRNPRASRSYPPTHNYGALEIIEPHHQKYPIFAQNGFPYFSEMTTPYPSHLLSALAFRASNKMALRIHSPLFQRFKVSFFDHSVLLWT